MTLPSVIGPINSKGNPPDGLINEIKTKYSIANPITAGIVTPTASATQKGSVDTVILWDSFNWYTSIDSGSYLQLFFPKRYIFLSGYSLRGIADGFHYQKKWRVEGFNIGEENDKDKWTLLARNTSTERSFCNNNGCNNNGCQSTSIATYSIPQINKAFQYIRWTYEEPSCSGYERIATSGVELYGTLSSVATISRKKNLCTQRACLLYRSNMFVIMTFILINIK